MIVPTKPLAGVGLKWASVVQLLNPSSAATAQPQYPPTATGNADTDDSRGQRRCDLSKNKAISWGGFGWGGARSGG